MPKSRAASARLHVYGVEGARRSSSGAVDYSGDVPPTAEFLSKTPVETIALSSIDAKLAGRALRVRKSPTWSAETLEKYVTNRQANAAKALRTLHENARRPAPMRGQSFSDRIDPVFRHAELPMSSSKANATLTRIRGLFANDRIALSLIDRVVLGEEAPEAVARSGVVNHIGWTSSQRLSIYVNGALRNLLSLVADELHIPEENSLP